MDQINVQGIEFFAYHGVLDSEKQQGQFFRVDCTFSFDTSTCHDDLTRTINYGDLAQDVVQFSQKNRYNLIETLANELAQHLLLQYQCMEEITITIHKPHAPIPVHFTNVTTTVTRGWKTCYLGIGSNLGNRKENLDLVRLEIAKENRMIELAASSYIETEPYGVTDQPRFLNAAIKVKTIFTPSQLLMFCHKVEHLAGRVKTRHWGERTLDVDILLYSNEVIFTSELKIPHPELHLRSFVLKPLCEIEPYLIHPIKKLEIQTLLKNVNEQEELV
jgi:dihydroneopterin aldolase/2-amino-4-hydroxy-6-hydroxymethyldihydropteridine diphosphokinase